MSVFAGADEKVYHHRFAVELAVDELHGGVPTDPKVIEAWIRSKLAATDELVQQMVAEAHVARVENDPETAGVGVDDADIEATLAKKVNGFKRTAAGELYIEGRQVKAMIKEAANIRWAKERWGPTKKGTRSFFAEHVFVPERVIGLSVKQPDRIDQRQVNTWRGTSFNYEEVVDDATVAFTVVTDHDFKRAQWAELFVTAERNGLGASRSQSYGTFEVVKFERIT